jgi:hypothetical protein
MCFQAHYSFRDISAASHTTVEMFSKMLSSTMDSIIFLYLGRALLGHSTTWTWHIEVHHLYNFEITVTLKFSAYYF